MTFLSTGPPQDLGMASLPPRGIFTYAEDSDFQDLSWVSNHQYVDVAESQPSSTIRRHHTYLAWNNECIFLE